MVEALKWFSAAIADKNAPIMVRRVALYYVAHLVGDMHQPLHAGRAGDQGGVDISVSYGVTTNLHYFWDSNLVEMETGSEEDIAKQLTANLTEEERLKWQAGDPTQWTNESLMLVRSYAYNTGPSGRTFRRLRGESPPDCPSQARPGRTQISLVAEYRFQIEKSRLIEARFLSRNRSLVWPYSIRGFARYVVDVALKIAFLAL